MSVRPAIPPPDTGFAVQDNFRLAESCDKPHSPPFSRRGGCASIRKSRSSAAQTGWLVNSNKNKERYAGI
jgi:hypothetical protein